MDTKARGLNGVLIPLPTRTLSPPPAPPPPPPSKCRTRFQSSSTTTTNVTSRIESSESEELQRLVHAPPFWNNKKKLSKQLSMCETPRDKAWEKRRRQILRQERKKNVVVVEDLTDEDFNELKGSIELGFGFNEKGGQRLCNTLPALDLYFAVNRQLSPSPLSTPHSQGSAKSIGPRSSSLDSPMSEESWKICGPGDSPQQVKAKLRHWAQAVACSVMHSF